MDIAGPKAVFMHCLPAYHDHKTTVGKEMGERFSRDAMEVTDEVFEGPQSIVFDFGMPQPDPAHPLTEFYLLLQHALDKAGRFALPALYARVQAPARHIYLDEAREYLSLSPTGREGDIRLLAEGSLQLLYSTLHVQPDGTPAALLLTEECTRATVAVQLLPPFVWEDPLPPLPDPCGADAAADHAGCDAGRYRPGSAGQKAGWHSDEQALAAPSEGRDTGGPAAESI